MDDVPRHAADAPSLHRRRHERVSLEEPPFEREPMSEGERRAREALYSWGYLIALRAARIPVAVVRLIVAIVAALVLPLLRCLGAGPTAWLQAISQWRAARAAAIELARLQAEDVMATRHKVVKRNFLWCQVALGCLCVLCVVYAGYLLGRSAPEEEELILVRHPLAMVRHGEPNVRLDLASDVWQCGADEFRSIADSDHTLTMTSLRLRANRAIAAGRVCVCAPMFGARVNFVAVRNASGGLPTHAYNMVATSNVATDRPRHKVGENWGEFYPGLDSIAVSRADVTRVRYQTPGACEHMAATFRNDTSFCVQVCLDMLAGRRPSVPAVQ